MLKHITLGSSLPPTVAKSGQQQQLNLAARLNSSRPNQMPEVSNNLEDVAHLRPTANSIHQHANMTLNQSIYANTVAVPKMNGSAVRHGSNGSNGSNGSSNKTNSGALNTSKLSSSNSPATTNQTKTSYMDSSRDHSHHELENTQLSPIARTKPSSNGYMRPSQSPPPPPPLMNASSASRYNTSLLSNGGVGDQSLLRSSHHLNSTSVTNKERNNASQRKLNLNASSLLPANVSKFMLLSKEAGVRVAITSLGLLCLISLLLALLSLVFLLRITPTSSSDEASKNYQFEFLTKEDFVSLYEVTLALCSLTLVLNLCCLVVCAIQFLFAIKLVKSPHGRQRTSKYLKGAASTRVCAIGGFFISIPLFLTGVILYTFLHFDSTPAIVSSVAIGLGIVFCGAAVVHNVFVWQKEKTANITKTDSPILSGKSGQQQSPLDVTAKTIGGLPQATLDLSGTNARELSTLV